MQKMKDDTPHTQPVFDFQDGDRVMIDFTKFDFRSRSLNPKLKRFIRSHKNKILTVHFEERFGRDKTICRFEQSPKWLFYCGHLKHVDSKKKG